MSLFHTKTLEGIPESSIESYFNLPAYVHVCVCVCVCVCMYIHTQTHTHVRTQVDFLNMDANGRCNGHIYIMGSVTMVCLKLEMIRP